MNRLGPIKIQGSLGVIFCGCVGGLLIWLVNVRDGQDPKVNQLVDPFISSVLGGAASVIFVYLISNTDRSDNNRLMTLALLSGLCWEPVLEAGTVFIDYNNQQNQARAAIKKIEEIKPKLSSFSNIDKEEKINLVNELNTSFQSIEKSINKVDNISIRKRIITAAQPIKETILELPQDENERDLLLLALEKSLNPNLKISPYGFSVYNAAGYISETSFLAQARGGLQTFQPDIIKWKIATTSGNAGQPNFFVNIRGYETSSYLTSNQLDKLNQVFNLLPKVNNIIEPVNINTATTIRAWRGICLGEEEKSFCPRSASHEFWSYVGENSNLRLKKSRGWLLYKP